MKVTSGVHKHLESLEVVVIGCHTKETDVLVSLIVMTVENITKFRSL